MLNDPSQKARCPTHDRPFELICTKRDCPKPRLGCTRCFYDKTHKECKPFSILIEDIEDEEFNDGLESWVVKPEDRRILNEAMKGYPYELEEYSQDILGMVEGKFKVIRNEINERLDKIEGEIKEVVKSKILKNETMSFFREHYSLRRLKELVSSVLSSSVDAQVLNSYFNSSLSSFLDDYLNEKDLIYFSKSDYSSFLAKKSDFLTNLLSDLGKGPLSFDYLKLLFVPQTQISTIRRFPKFGNSWGYVKDKLDCISFKSSSDLLFHGLGLLKPVKPGGSLKASIRILAGESSEAPTLAIKEVSIGQDSGDMIEKVLLNDPLMLKQGQAYSVCCSIEGDDTFNGSEGLESVSEGSTTVYFTETLVMGTNRDNNTNVSHGQIPEIYYTLVEGDGN